MHRECSSSAKLTLRALCLLAITYHNLTMAQEFKNEAEKDNALRRVRISITAILIVTAILFIFMAYKTFFK